MKKLLLIFLVGLVSFVFNHEEVNAQNVVDGAYTKQRTVSRKPVPYAVTREADIMWSKKIWRIIDLREKMNHPLFYPLNPIDNRMSLFSLLIYGIENEGLTPYSIADDEFKVPMTLAQVEEAFGATEETTFVVDPDTGEEIEQTIKNEIKPEEVKQIMVKEEWYFDKNLSSIQVRIVGLCPIRFYTREGSDEIIRSQGFWIYFPEARPLFASHEVYNPYNDANRISFDDLFHKRRFSSYIIGEANVYDNRQIIEYAQGVHTLYEAERIKAELFNLEHDLWEY